MNDMKFMKWLKLEFMKTPGYMREGNEQKQTSD